MTQGSHGLETESLIENLMWAFEKRWNFNFFLKSAYISVLVLEKSLSFVQLRI